MYCSVIQLTNNPSQFQVNMNDGNVVHKFLTYIQDNNRQNEGILYYHKGNKLYVQTNTPLNTFKLPQFGMSLVRQYDLSDIISKLHHGAKIRFKTRVSPMKQKTGTRRKEFIGNPHQRTEWLIRKFNNGGLDVTEMYEIEHKPISFSKNKKCTIPTVTFIGEATIKNLDAFAKMVQHGVGKHKNYGAGMLHFRPIE